MKTYHKKKFDNFSLNFIRSCIAGKTFARWSTWVGFIFRSSFSYRPLIYARE